MIDINEEWRDIPGYNGRYIVSNRGQVKYLFKNVTFKLQKDTGGYLFVVLSLDNKRKACLIHRLVLTAFDRPPKKDEECNHKDGNKGNNYRENLEWVTHKENEHHKRYVLKKQMGENNPRSKLDNEKVREIRVLLKEGKVTQRQIAKRYGVSCSVIGCINTGKTWKHI